MNRKWMLLLLLLGCISTLVAAPIKDEAIPDTLKPWVPWVLYGEENSRCPFSFQQFDSRQCRWASVTELDLSAEGGVFSQSWQAVYPQWVPLPGRHDQWPQSVVVDGLPAPVIPQQGRPHVYLDAGSHLVSGSFFWKNLPQTVSLPVESGLVTVTIDGESQPFPHIDARGLLWLREDKQIAQQQQDATSIIVQRHLIDAIPFQIETRIELNVSGNERELLLQGALLDDFIPMQLNSPLPARMESDGRLRVQAKAGQWVLNLLARAPESVTSLMLPANREPWPQEEVWVFEAQPQLRQVNVSGAKAIDPKNTRLPPQWHQWPAYQLQNETKLVLEQKLRGDSSQRLDQLSLQRTWWLDFDGKGFSLQDRIGGEVHGRYRLPMNAAIDLGRVEVNGEDQFITRLEGEQQPGIELRQGQLDLVADSRWTEGDSLPATGWDADFQRVSAELNLPPGWRLLAASGVDKSSGSWLSRWTLLDLFLLFIIAASFSHLWGKGWGLTALIAMTVMYHEQSAPVAVWLNVLAASALLKVVPTGKFRVWIQRYFVLSLLAIVLISLPFMVQQAREGLYPQLEYPGYKVSPAYEDAVRARKVQQSREEAEIAAIEEKEARSKAMVAPLTSRLQLDQDMSYQRSLTGYDADTKLQTGPGLPDWHWRSSTLTFSGPVDRDQQIGLWLLSPIESRLLAFARIALLVALIICVSGWRRGVSLKAAMPWLFAGIVISSGAVPTPALAAEALPPTLIAEERPVPGNEILEQLKQRLLAAPDCVPQCADSSTMRVVVEGESLLIRQRIEAAEPVLVPLPGQRQHWTPQRILLDGDNASALHHDPQGQLWLHVPAGTHEVTLQGMLPQQASIELVLPLKPHQLELKHDERWAVQGNAEPGRISDLVLKRQQRQDQSADGKQVLTPTSLPALLRVERRLVFGQQWQLQTIVTRMTPADSLVQVAIPLLEGEKVIQSGVSVRDGVMPVRLQQGQSRFQWQSLLTESAQLQLTAADTDDWIEHWSLRWAPIWHVDWEGLPLIMSGQQGQIDWRPWPGEQLLLNVQRPAGEAGQTLTLDRSRVELQPGQRSSLVNMRLSLRSSLGQQHAITLPEQAQLNSVTLDGEKLPLELVENKLILPVHPGVQDVAIEWRQPSPVKAWLTTPQIDVGMNGVNHEIDITMPSNRWILAVGGPRLGPAVLMWGVLVVLVIAAAALGRWQLTPLKTHHWILLLVGLTQAALVTLLIVVGWLLALGWRGKRPWNKDRAGFNLLQIALGLLTFVALSSLFVAIQQGLLGQPDMQIIGNGSFRSYLHWYQDRNAAMLPQAWVLSVPLFVYRTLMLLWALWLAFALLGWLRWGWQCYSRDGIWRHVNLNLSAAKDGWDNFKKKTEGKNES